MNDKTFNIIAALCLILIIGVMSWRAMHPAPYTGPSVALSYYAGPGITPAMFPKDSSAVTVPVGTFSYPASGKTLWTPHGMAPATIPQRQINLQFNFDGMPDDPAKTVERIESVIKNWSHKGDIINVLVFNYAPLQPDIARYKALVKALTHASEELYAANPYVVYPMANLWWIEKGQNDLFKKIADNKAPFIIPVPQTPVDEALLGQLEKLPANVILLFPKGVMKKDIDMPRLAALSNLHGVILTLDPHHLPPPEMIQVGLYPKF